MKMVSALLNVIIRFRIKLFRPGMTHRCHSERLYDRTLHLGVSYPHARKTQVDGIQAVSVDSKINLISDYFNVSRSKAETIIYCHRHLRKVNDHDLFHNILTLKWSGLNPDDVQHSLKLLVTQPVRLEHQIGILQELQLLNLSACHYTKFSKIFQSSVEKLKTAGLLPYDYNFTGVLYALGVPEFICKKIDFPHEIDKFPLSQVHSQLSIVYLSWLLQCEAAEIQYIKKTYRIGTKSMRVQGRVVQRLIENWGFSVDQILRSRFPLCCSRINVELIEYHVKHLCHADPKEIVLKNSRILLVPPQQLCEISNLLVMLEVSMMSAGNMPIIFNMQPSTIKNRIKDIQQIPELSEMLTHPRLPQLIVCLRKVMGRLSQVYPFEDNHISPSVNMLLDKPKKFSSFVVDGYRRVPKRDILLYLADHFKVKPNIIGKMIQLKGDKLVSVWVIIKNLTFLYAQGFEGDEIFSNLEVLCYPPNKVSQLFQKKINIPDVRDKPYALQLLIYYLDKECV